MGGRIALLSAVVVAAVALNANAAWAASDTDKGAKIDTASVEPADDEPKSLLDMIRRAQRANEEPAPDVETTTESKAAPSASNTAPTAIRALIQKHAKAHGVPADLAEAVVHVESRFNPRARGRAGEVGLMQIKPATARGIGYLGSTKDLYDPDTNIRWGMLYLAKAYQMAGGDTCGTILRYNGGHAAKRMTKGVRAYCSKVNRYVASL
ncbi:lytic transglycosylase domain-containing protein [Mongoliimonas terrestris]|uniref:lytic transglycosylase domain-containing protein n=1 Tax=Mongoliimonas terrestris TaxID=1709001 RepID=UPI0009497468|nr:transglycosylase SLT domain-containing protein [Mongoliimonas terrestris]